MFETICDKIQMVLMWVEMKKILLITTGGTVASIQTEKGLVPGIDGKNLVSYVPSIVSMCNVLQLFNLDSTK